MIARKKIKLGCPNICVPVLNQNSSGL